MGAEPIIGELPRGWNYSTLSNLCAASSGNIQTGPFGSQLHASDYVSDGIPCVMPQNIGDNRINEQDIARITSDDANRLHRHILRKGDIVYSRRGDVERRALVRAREDGWFCGTGCLRIRLGADVTDADWLAYYLGDLRVRAWIVRHAHGATMANLNTSILGALPVAVPPRPEQRAIAHILGTLDDKIDLNRQMSATLEAMARALFESWFVRFDPVRAKAEGRDTGLPAEIADLFPDSFEESEIGEVPKGWSCGTVADLCAAIYSGGTPSTQTTAYWNGDVPWLSSGETRETFIIDTAKRITTAGVANSSTRLARALSTVIASAGQGNTRGQTSLLGIDCYVNQSVVVLSSNTATSSPTHLFFDLERRYEEFRRVSDGHSSRGSLTTRLLAELSAVLPSMEVISRFESTVAPLVYRAFTTLRESRELVRLRDTLLPKLISGDMRVPDAERFLADAGV